MLILSRVCAEFHDASGAVLFTVTPETRLTFQEAPEAIRQDPLFNLLRNDHSIEVSDDGPRKKQLEQDPLLPPETEKEPASEAVYAGDAEKPADPKSSGRKAAKP
jgi:hypothetical protein